MSGSEGRRDTKYRAAKALFKTGQYPCWLCNTRPGTWVDHYPPLHEAPHWRLWQGEYRPACPTCQNRQGAQITNSRHRHPSRQW